MVAKSFRATSGLDAAGEKVINVGMASPATGTDAVNVDYFKEYNTLQQYDATRGYTANMAVIYDSRVWYCTTAIASPAGAFDSSKWTVTSNEPQWDYSSLTPAAGTPIKSGQYIFADGKFAELTYVLPDTPSDGNVIVVKDGGGQTGVNSITIKSNTKQIRYHDVNSTQHRITHPAATATFIYANNLWQVSESYDNRDSTTVTATGNSFYQLQSGMSSFCNAASGVIVVQLPRYANSGDKITLYNTDTVTTVNTVTLRVYAGSGHTIGASATSVVYQKPGYNILIFDAALNRWSVTSGDTAYLSRTGGTLTGRLDSSSASTFIGQVAWTKLTKPTSASVGNWSVNVTAAADYASLPGYAVGVKSTDPISGLTFISSYTYTPAPGIFTQHGTDVNNCYQVWMPRPITGTGESDKAQTMWVRQFNPITNVFDAWGRVYTTNNPPTPSEIGAFSTVGTVLKNLTITDYIDIGPIRIRPDLDNKSAIIEWIGT